MILTSLDRYRDAGLLILRMGIGIMFVIHGYPKITGGPEFWVNLGKATGALGITFAPVFWGFMAAASEFFGGILLITGFFFRPAAAMMLSTMIVATSMHLTKGDGLMVASHAIEAGILFFSLIFIGPGRFSLDAKYGGK
jgi:putative oxidoreductase